MMFIYNGKEFKNVSEIISYGLKLPEDQQKQFAVAYAASSQFAISNLKYFSGYYSVQEMKKIQEIFGV